MTKKEEANKLQGLLDAISVDNEKNKTIDNTVEVKPRKAKRRVTTKRFAGMMIPKPIYEICVYLKSIMEEQNTYSKALDLQLYNIAIQYYAYNEMCMDLVDPDIQFKPKASSLCQVAETLRKALREIAWTKGGCGRNQSIEGPDETPLSNLISAVMNEEVEDEEMIKPNK